MANASFIFTNSTNSTSGNSLEQIFNSSPSDQLIETKLLSSLILFLSTLLCGYLPVRTILNQNYVRYAIFAGGGVLLATAFCHLMPETHDNYWANSSPIAHTINETIITNENQAPTMSTNSSFNGSSLQQQILPNNKIELDTSEARIPYPEIALCFGFFFIYFVEQLMVQFLNNHTHEHPCDSNSQNQPQRTISDSRSSFANSQISMVITNSEIGYHPPEPSELYKFIRGLFIVSAFLAHSIFDGVSIGSQETVKDVWTVFLAISCHKLIIAAVVGIELFAATLESHLWTIVHLVTFSIMSPIGIILVVIAQNSFNLNANHPAMLLVQSFATGTLLYIVFIEILQPKENEAYEKNKLGKGLSLIGGFLIMFFVLISITD